MAMRQNCKHFASRTYPSGDTVRKCDLNLAPEAPWRCPQDCGSFEQRLADVNWKHGSLIVASAPPEPDSLGEDDSIAELLASAEQIVAEAGPEIVKEHQAELARKAEIAKRESNKNPLSRQINRIKRWFKKPNGKNDKDDNK